MNLLANMKIEENGIAMITDLGITFQLNETGKKIVELIKEGKNKDEIITIIAEEYEEDWKKVYIDVEDFFIKLKVYGVYNES